jgi:hypothetical protein
MPSLVYGATLESFNPPPDPLAVSRLFHSEAGVGHVAGRGSALFANRGGARAAAEVES